jgi:hypothetical protein
MASNGSGSITSGSVSHSFAVNFPPTSDSNRLLQPISNVKFINLQFKILLGDSAVAQPVYKLPAFMAREIALKYFRAHTLAHFSNSQVYAPCSLHLISPYFMTLKI